MESTADDESLTNAKAHPLKNEATSWKELYSKMPLLRYKCHDCKAVLYNYKSFIIHVTSCSEFQHKTSMADDCADMLSSDLNSENSKKFTWEHDFVKVVSKSSYKCHGCENIFVGNIDMLNHVKSCIELKKYEFFCVQCNDIFVWKDAYKLHCFHVHGKQLPFKCKECGKLFEVYAGFRNHHRLHNDEKPFTCDLCLKSFRTRKILREHMKRHLRSRCDVCGKQLSSRTALILHINTHSVDKQFCCEVCGKKFAFKRYLSAHHKLHFPEKIPCRFCVKTCVHKKNIKRHEKMCPANKDRLLKVNTCKVCRKNFRGQLQLTVHMRIHTGEQPYKCKICSMAFSSKATLAAHNRCHKMKLNRRSYICEICGKAFTMKACIKRHMVVHTKERDFECPICKMKFAQHGSIKRHISTKHKALI